MKKSVLVIVSFFLVSCGDGANNVNMNGVCTGYTSHENSPYSLPYPVGKSYHLSQGNCSNWSHSGKARFSYDFDMEIGDAVLASRGGQVILVDMRYPFGGTKENEIQIRHEDGSIASYIHLLADSNLVSAGDWVQPGDQIASSGSSGTTDPHMHFHVIQSTGWDTIPITFSNTGDHPNGLEEDTEYEAFPR